MRHKYSRVGSFNRLNFFMKIIIVVTIYTHTYGIRSSTSLHGFDRQFFKEMMDENVY